ncbi:hypothetical protein HDV01_006358 [Terramyces sp. JEL0728]|nr:hypothetical protein HDV01_006358 [Terramyces sp. JEL0728]
MDSREAKKREEKQAKLVAELLARPENQKCVDCNLRGPRWASVNIGCFLCIRCAGIHRKMGTHISKVKSTNLDSWQPEWFEFMASMGNDKVNAKYLSKGNAPPVNDANDKYHSTNDLAEYSQAMAMENVKAQQKTMAAMVDINRQQLQTLKNMGFNDEALCRHALEKYKGNLEHSVDYLVKKQKHAEKEQSAQRHATNTGSRPNTSHEREAARQTTNRPQKSLQFDQFSGGLAHLAQMGFTNAEKNQLALQKTNGNLEQAVALLVSWSNGNLSNIQQQTFNPPQQTFNPPQQTFNPPQQTFNPPQQLTQDYNPPQQAKPKPAPQKSAAEDLFGLFDTPAQQPVNQFQQPQFQNYNQGFAQQNPFGDQFAGINQPSQNQFQASSFLQSQPQQQQAAPQNSFQQNPFQAQQPSFQGQKPAHFQQPQSNQFQSNQFQQPQANPFQQQASTLQQQPQSNPFQQQSQQVNPFQNQQLLQTQQPNQFQTSQQPQVFQQNNQLGTANPFDQSFAQPIKPQQSLQNQNPHQQLMMQQQQDFQEKQQKESILSMYRAAPAQPAFGQPMGMQQGFGMQHGFAQPGLGMQQNHAPPMQGFGSSYSANYQTQNAGFNPQTVPKPAQQDMAGDIFKQSSAANINFNSNNAVAKKQSSNNDLFKDLAAFGR